MVMCTHQPPEDLSEDVGLGAGLVGLGPVHRRDVVQHRRSTLQTKGRHDAHDQQSQANILKTHGHDTPVQ